MNFLFPTPSVIAQASHDAITTISQTPLPSDDPKWDRVQTQLMEYLHHSQARIRETAAVTLSQFRTTSVVQALISCATKDRAIEVRREAISSLGKMPNAEITSILLQALQYRKTRDYAARALMFQPDPSATSELLNWLKTRSRRKQAAAALALRYLTVHEAVPDLLRILSDRPKSLFAKFPIFIGFLSSTHSVEAARTLGVWAGTTQIPILIKTLNDFDPALRVACIEALRDKGQSFMHWFQKDKENHLGEIIDAIIPLLDDIDLTVVSSAVDALIILNSDKARPPLQKVLSTRNLSSYDKSRIETYLKSST